MDELVNNCLLIFEEESSESEYNPWNVRDVSEFLKYCCPECHEQSNNLESFANHAIENHPKGKTFFCDNYAKEFSSLENHESMVENLENTMSEIPSSDFAPMVDQSAFPDEIFESHQDMPEEDEADIKTFTKTAREMVISHKIASDTNKKYPIKVLSDSEKVFYNSLATYMEDKENNQGFLLKMNQYKTAIDIEGSNEAAVDNDNVMKNAQYIFNATQEITVTTSEVTDDCRRKYFDQ